MNRTARRNLYAWAAIAPLLLAFAAVGTILHARAPVSSFALAAFGKDAR